jgi:prepilin-type N-terminal cleavage/methylation domain-containing protein
MKNVTMKARAGFSLIELLVSLTLTAVIGVAMTGLFVTQSRFLDQQQKAEYARNVTRSATNIMMSELRMLERDSGVVAASDSSITVRVPYAMGIVCATTSSLLTLSMLPVDSVMFADARIAGFAYRKADGSYNYVATTTTPALAGSSTACSSAGITDLTSQGGAKRTIATGGTTHPAPIGSPVLLYQVIRYHFGNSATVSGRKGLYRAVPAASIDEEIVAPFDTSARFRFYVNDAKTSQTAVPTNLKTLTGIDLILNSIEERPTNGVYKTIPARTAVFFKNRRT